MDTTILEDKELAREFFAFLTRKVADANRRIDDLERKNGEKASALKSSSKSGGGRTLVASAPPHVRFNSSGSVNLNSGSRGDKNHTSSNVAVNTPSDAERGSLRRSTRGKELKCKQCLDSKDGVECKVDERRPNLLRRCTRCREKKRKCIWPPFVKQAEQEHKSNTESVSSAPKRKRSPTPVASGSRKRISSSRTKDEDGSDTSSVEIIENTSIIRVQKPAPVDKGKRRESEDEIQRDIAAEMTGLYALIGEVQQTTAQTNVEIHILRNEHKVLVQEFREFRRKTEARQEDILKQLRSRR